MRRPRLVTVSTDAGPVYAAQMKGVLLRSLPPGHVVELASDLAPHRIPEAAFLLRQMAQEFPAGTVHLAIVDPGVGGPRAPLVIRCRERSLLVGPDNGLLAPLAERLGGGAAFRLDPEAVVPGRPPSPTFEGRDLFAPAAARLALGDRPSSMGSPSTYRRLRLPEASRSGRSVRGEVLHVDHFGNVITNIPADWVPVSMNKLRVTVRSSTFSLLPRVRTYSDLPLGGLGVLGSSFGVIELAIREGRASARVRAVAGDAIRIHPDARRRPETRKGPK